MRMSGKGVHAGEGDRIRVHLPASAENSTPSGEMRTPLAFAAIEDIGLVLQLARN
jgi:hypothetical protein